MACERPVSNENWETSTKEYEDYTDWDGAYYYDEDTEENWNDSGEDNIEDIWYKIPQANQLRKITGIENLFQIKKLVIGVQSKDWLEQSQFDDLSPISNLSKLEYLDFSQTQVKDISPLIGLSNLKTIVCCNSGITDLSPLSNLKIIKELNFAFTPIDDLKPLSLLPNLTKLYCGGTSIYNLSPLSSLKHLTKLDCHLTKVHDLTPLQNLHKIRYLNISNTKISDLSPLVGLKNLIELHCDHTNISNLLPILHVLRKIPPPKPSIQLSLFQDWPFDGCPLISPPIEVAQQGTPAILRYFEDLEKQGTDQIHEAKLLLIGEGGAGKTTLCRKLFDPNAELPQEKDRTKGIDIHPLYFDIPGKPDKQFRLNIWDFAGQGKYQSAHSFFYTHRSLYVLVDDTRTLNENDAYRTLYNNWLQTAELFGGKSPVLVLHNEKDGCARTGFSLGGFQEHFGFVHGELFRINLGGGDTAKIEDLRRQIERQALALPHIGDTVPKTWVKVRDAIEIERQAHPYISAERYRALCEAEGIADPERQSDLSHYFHDLGVFLHFQDNPLLKRDVFLQNQWVTDAVYKILDDAQIAGEQQGRFTPADLKRLWHESAYRERRDELLALMLQFELCYQVQDTDTYICPQLLPGEHSISDFGISDFGTVTLEGSDFGREVLQLRYLYVFMPKGLLYRLIVRLHRHIAQGQTAVWNAGVVLERAGAKAEITESLDRRTIFVRAVGLRAKELVTIINEELERLHAPFGERLKVTVRIPCNCRTCKGSQTPHFYDKTNLDNRLSKGRMAVECDVSFEEVKVLGLLEGVFGPPSYPTDRTNTDVKVLFSAGKTEQALEALVAMGLPDALGLQARFVAAHREYKGGRLAFEEYERIVNQVNDAGLGML